MRMRLAMVVLAFFAATASAETLNGFEISRHLVPREEILAGGPPRDGIRSVDAPEFVSPEEATWVAARTPVLGVAVGGEARAYPVHLIEYHQLVNDRLGEVPVVVSYDPLTGSPAAYDRRVDGKLHTFGVSGLIYNGGFLLYDRETESLWSQFDGRAISGPLSGRSLLRFQIRQEPLAVWRARQPRTRVLVRPFPQHIDYRQSRYSAYWVSDKVPFPVRASDRRYHPKEITLGVVVDGRARAYLGSILTAAGGRIVDEMDGHKLRIAYDGESGTFEWEADPALTVTDAYWFAWKAFHPDTEIWSDRLPPAPE